MTNLAGYGRGGDCRRIRRRRRRIRATARRRWAQPRAGGAQTGPLETTANDCRGAACRCARSRWIWCSRCGRRNHHGDRRSRSGITDLQRRATPAASSSSTLTWPISSESSTSTSPRCWHWYSTTAPMRMRGAAASCWSARWRDTSGRCGTPCTAGEGVWSHLRRKPWLELRDHNVHVLELVLGVTRTPRWSGRLNFDVPGLRVADPVTWPGRTRAVAARPVYVAGVTPTTWRAATTGPGESRAGHSPVMQELLAPTKTLTFVGVTMADDRLTELERRLQTIEDERAIERLIASYGRWSMRVNPRRRPIVVPDGVYDVEGWAMNSRDDVAAMVASDAHQGLIRRARALSGPAWSPLTATRPSRCANRYLWCTATADTPCGGPRQPL
ncbi:putative oxidoreductase [Mycobacterium xenopi 4042]|uniref:Putative oxidoreductase n=1 Tax=Mycobacterium xenopi 4042 TaxID=1299334 RepID=X7ZCD9_MYCXE|nr:putative oxidoreductase [Mycobacterium xenopi 4042]